MTAAPAPSYRPTGVLSATPLAPYEGPWGPRLAAHLLRRAGFGGSPADVARLSSVPMRAAVDSLLQFPRSDALPALPDVAATAGQAMSGASALGAPALGDAAAESRREVRLQRRAQERANALWWLNRMLATPAPLQEKLTLFLHGHFATASGTKGIYGLEIVQQNALLRRYALGNWRELTHSLARDPAMLKYLDQARSRKAQPNENFARELMELFTLGIGNYTENDVRESARAFTGFTLARRNGPYVYNAVQHDDGEKTFLGHTGNFGGDEVIDIIFAQPAAPRWFARKLLAFFVYSDPEPELVDATAALIRKNDFNMLPVVAALLRSKIFYDARSYRALVKSPVEFVIGSYRLFGLAQIKPDVLAVLARMGQIPFHPPSVKGWDGGAQWLNTQTVLARENFSSFLTSAPELVGERSWLTAGVPATANEAAAKLVATILQGDASPASLAHLQSYLDGRETSANGMLSGENSAERIRGAAYLAMALPAYQLA